MRNRAGIRVRDRAEIKGRIRVEKRIKDRFKEKG